MLPPAASWRSEARCTALPTRADGGPIFRRAARRWTRSSRQSSAQGSGRAIDAAIAIDVAASQLRKGSRYVLAAERRELSSEELAELLLEWCRDYPIISVEDPLAEDDDEGMRAFTARAGERLQVIGDDYLVTSAARIAAAAQSSACNAVLLKPNQAGTVTETAEALAAARAAGWNTIISARSGETEDVTIVHLAIGWGVGQLKVGSFARGERTAKWNEALRIEEALGGAAPFGEPRLLKRNEALTHRRYQGRWQMADGRRYTLPSSICPLP